jgi:hypothetical protein
LYVNQFPKERLEQFANLLGRNNQIETIRVASHCHVASKNDPRFPKVFVFSKCVIYNGKRIRVSIICYSRKSIGDYCIRPLTYHHKAIDWILGEYNEALIKKTSTDPAWLTALPFSSRWFDLATAEVDPPLLPDLYHSTMINAVEELKQGLGISVVEQHSLATAFNYLHGAPSYVAQAAISSMKHEETV